jgi:hypothetical protein
MAGTPSSSISNYPTGIHVGLGSKTASTQKIFEQGAPQSTGVKTDLAIAGEGFFKVQMYDGTEAYTRDGAWKIDANRQIVNHSGYRLVPEIILPENFQIDSLAISEDGRVTCKVGGSDEQIEVGNIELYRFVNPAGLTAVGGHLFKISEAIGYHGIETICLMGNHDAAVFEVDHFYDLIGRQHQPRLMKRDGINLLFLDACYLHTGEHYSPRFFCEWTDTFFPETEKLNETLAALEGNTYVFMHQNIDPNIVENHRLSNDTEIRRIPEESGKVRTVYQGHYHPGCRSEHNGIRYITLPAMCENEDAFVTEELL